MTEIISYCTTWRTLANITKNVKPQNRDVGTLVGRLLAAGRLERRERRKRGCGVVFEYRRVT